VGQFWWPLTAGTPAAAAVAEIVALVDRFEIDETLQAVSALREQGGGLGNAGGQTLTGNVTSEHDLAHFAARLAAVGGRRGWRR
jgi:hypothetical protein